MSSLKQLAVRMFCAPAPAPKGAGYRRRPSRKCWGTPTHSVARHVALQECGTKDTFGWLMEYEAVHAATLLSMLRACELVHSLIRLMRWLYGNVVSCDARRAGLQWDSPKSNDAEPPQPPSLGTTQLLLPTPNASLSDLSGCKPIYLSKCSLYVHQYIIPLPAEEFV